MKRSVLIGGIGRRELVRSFQRRICIRGKERETAAGEVERARAATKLFKAMLRESARFKAKPSRDRRRRYRGLISVINGPRSRHRPIPEK